MWVEHGVKHGEQTVLALSGSGIRLSSSELQGLELTLIQYRTCDVWRTSLMLYISMGP